METTIKDILYIVLTVLSPLAFKLLWQVVSAKVADTRYAEAVSCVFSAVDYTNQVFVDSLKQSGSFDAEAQAVALKKAKDTAIELMEAGTVAWLTNTFDCVDSWLEVQIEAAVKEAKR